MSCTDVQTIQAGNGTKTQFSFDFPYIFKSEIHVYFWNATTKEYDEVLTTDGTYPWQITDANPTIVEFTSTAPPAPATPVDPGETAVDNVKIRRVTNIDDIRALFNPGSAIRSDDLNNNFEQLKYAIQESNCPGISDDVDQYLKDYYWDRFDNTLYSADTWRSDDATIATTAALDQRFQDEVNDTLTKAEFAAGGNVMPNNDNAVPTTGAVNDYINEVITNDIGGSDGISITDDGDGTITVGISANSVDFDRIKNEDIITEAEQDAGLPVASDSNLFTSLAAARRFDTFVQTSTPSGSDWEVGKTWLQNDSEKTVRIWDGAAWVAVASGGAFTTLDKVVYVDAVNGDDSLNGHRISNPKRTIKAAVQQINAETDADGDGSVIIVAPGVYQEVAPIDIQKKDVSIIGQALRSCIVHPTPATETESLFRLNSGSYVAGLTLTGVKASGTRGGNPLDTDATYGLPTSQGWNFSFYRGATIVKSPYIANCTNFSDSEIDNSDLNAHTPAGGSGGDIDSSPTGGGILVDGSTVDSNSPLRSMVCDSYTHVGLDGPGIFVTNNGYCQATSSYSFFTHYHIKCLNGGQANLAASTTDFGRYSLIVDGRSSSAIFTATTTTTASDGATTFTIGAPTAGSSWHGTATRPQANQLVDIGGNTYSILSSTPNGSGWDVEISRPDPNNLSINLGLDGAVSSGAAVSFYLRSMIASSGHTMEYVGSGTDYRALPENGGVPVEANQTVELNNGKIWAAITDHQGKFTVGPTFNVDQVTGYVNIANGAIGIPQLIEDLDLNGFTLSDSTGNVVIDDVLDVNTNKIINVVDPTNAQDAATKNYVDTSSSNPNYVAVTGDTMSGTLDMDGNKVTNLAAPTASNDAARKVDVDGKVNKTGDTMTGDLTMSSQSDIRFGDSDNSAYIALRAPGSVGSSYTLSLPTSVGNAGEALVTDASGNLGWSSSLGTVVDNIVEGNSKVEVIDTGSDGQIQFITEGVQRMHINASGNVGVGTASPLASSGFTGLTTSGSTGGILWFAKAGAQKGYIYGQDNDVTLASTDSSGVIRLLTGGNTERLRITSDGKLGVGTSSPIDVLHVASSGSPAVVVQTTTGSANAALQLRNSAGNLGTALTYLSASDDFRINHAGSNVFNINSSGNVGIGTVSPLVPFHVLTSTTNTPGLFEHSGSVDSYLYIKNSAGGAYIASRTNDLSFHTSAGATERARIDSSGRLLVGTTLSQAHASANLVEIGNYTLTNAGITINSPTSGAGLINFGDSAASNRRGRIEYTHASDAFRFYTADAERVRVTSAGNVGIGAASPSAILHTVASASFDPTNVSDFTGVGLFLQSPSGIAGDGNFGSALAWSRPEDSSRFKTAIAPVQEGSDQDRQGLAFFTADDASALVAPEERLRISNTGRVGIGTTSPGDLNVNANNLVVGSGSGSEGMTIYSGTANNGNIFFADGTGANAYAGYIQFSHNADIMKFGIQGQDAMYIDSSRRVLIGTSSALTGGGTQFGKFVLLGNSSGANSSGIVVIGRNAAATSLVAGNTVGEIYFGDTAAAHFASISCAADASTGSGDYPGRLVFSTTADGASSPTERMRITSGGRVTLGSDASGLLGGSATTSYMVTPAATANTGGVGIEGVTVSTSTRYHQSFSNPNGVVGSISTNGSATAFNTSSDYRLKENVVDIADGITRVKQLQPRRFNFIADADTTVDGFIAHEAQTVVPEAVTGAHNEVDEDGNPVYQGIDQSKLVPLLTAALQEALAEIESLKARVTALEP